MNPDVKEYLEEIADEYDAPLDAVYELYQMMPTELYDGLVTELEDMEGQWDEWMF